MEVSTIEDDKMKFKVNDILIGKKEFYTVSIIAIKIMVIEDDKYTIKYLNDDGIFTGGSISYIEKYFRYPTDKELKLIQLKIIK